MSCSIVLRQLPRSGRASRLTSARNLWPRNPAPAGSHLVNRAPTKLRSLFANPGSVSLVPRLAHLTPACLYPAMQRRAPAKRPSRQPLSHSLLPPLSTIRTATPADFSIQTVQSHDHQPKKGAAEPSLTSQDPHYA